MENASSNNSCGLRRRSMGNDRSGQNPLKLEVGFQITDGGVIKATPSPSGNKRFPEDDNNKPSSSLTEFRKKQQSFEIHIEDCDEEEMSGGSSDEGGSRPITPVPPHLPDFSGNTTHQEREPRDFLQVSERDVECLTDVSEGESENEDEIGEDQELPPNTVIKRVPS